MRSGERANLLVDNQSSGIPKQTHGRIFPRFGQAANQEHARLPGSGLGLSICKALATHMGGDIGFSPELGRGSVFWTERPSAKSVVGTA